MVGAQTEKALLKFFKLSLAAKAIDALAELLIAFLILFTDTLSDVATYIVRGELAEDPHDFAATHALRLTESLRGGAAAVAAYLALEAAAKLFLVAVVSRGKLWAYPMYAVFIGGLTIFQAGAVLRGSLVIVPLSLFNCFVIWLTIHEYRRLSGRLDRK